MSQLPPFKPTNPLPAINSVQSIKQDQPDPVISEDIPNSEEMSEELDDMFDEMVRTPQETDVEEIEAALAEAEASDNAKSSNDFDFSDDIDESVEVDIFGDSIIPFDSLSKEDQQAVTDNIKEIDFFISLQLMSDAQKLLDMVVEQYGNLDILEPVRERIKL